MKDFKFAESCKYVTLTNTLIVPFAVVMNMDTWNSLPRDVQTVMDNLRVQQAMWTGAYMDNHVEQANMWSKNVQNVEFIELPPAEKAKWDAKLNFVIEEWVKKADQKGLPGEAIIADIKAFTKMYTGQ